jgi:hypothetical protein
LAGADYIPFDEAIGRGIVMVDCFWTPAKWQLVGAHGKGFALPELLISMSERMQKS